MVSLRKQHEYLILALNRQLKVIMLKASQRDMDGGLAINLQPPPAATNFQDLPPIIPIQKSVRRRHNSSTSSPIDPVNIHHRPSIVLHRNGQATVEAVGNEVTFVTSPTSRSASFSFPPVTPTITTTTTMLNNIYTVPIQEQEYVNALVVCPATQSKLFVGKYKRKFFNRKQDHCLLFFSGASDGSLTIYEIIWPASSSSDRLIQLNLLTSFTAHAKEIDDLAVDPFGTWLISVSRDHHVQIRQCSPPFDKHSELDLCQFGMNKTVKTPKPSYRIRHVRFGIVPSSSSSNATSFLYTSLIPQAIVDKLVSYIVQWTENRQHQFIVRRRRAVSYDRISAIAVSNCGQYVSIGDSGGWVRIYETDRLRLLYEHRAHSIFVTDLSFMLREENYLYETSVLSISADKNLYVHNVHPPQTNIFSVSFLIVIGLLLLFLLLSQIRFRFH
jgi:WD40 repeat protein